MHLLKNPGLEQQVLTRKLKLRMRAERGSQAQTSAQYTESQRTVLTRTTNTKRRQGRQEEAGELFRHITGVVEDTGEAMQEGAGMGMARILLITALTANTMAEET